MTSTLLELYSEIEPYETGRIKVDDLHSIYYELCGNPNATQTAIVIHGGPGGGISPYYRQFFDPKAYRVLLYDQRGAGQSTPNVCLVNNTTWHLVADIEKLRKHFGVERFVVFGGSWGSTLALAYAETHPERVIALILRGIFLLREIELRWFYQEGASFIFPDAWEKFLEPIPVVERHHLMSAYHRRLTGKDEAVRLQCALAWSIWELTTSRLFVDPKYIAQAQDDAVFALQFASIECHYFVNGGFFDMDGHLLHNADRIADIPGVIVQGRYDLVCPAKSAWDLSKRWKKGELKWVHDAGHSAKEPGIVSELLRATELYKTAK